MLMKKRSECPVSYTLDIMGDKWSLLIVRDMALDDKSTFGEFLLSAEKIATNILASRLKQLNEEGFVIKYPVAGKARIAYCLTEKGISLIPLLIETLLWGAANKNNNPKEELIKSLQQDKPMVIKQLSKKLRKKYNSIKNTIEE